MAHHPNREDRIRLVEGNLRENDQRLAKGIITETQHTAIKKDGNECLRDIRQRKFDRKKRHD